MPLKAQPSPEIQASSTLDVISAKVASQATTSLANAKEYTESIITTIPIPLLVLKNDLRVHIASQAFYDTFHVTAETTEGRLVYELGNGQWNIPQLRKLLEEILPNNLVFTDYEVEHTFDEIGHCTMLLNGRQLDHLQLIQLVILDISKRKQIEMELQANHDHLQETLSQLRGVQAQLIHQERLAAVGALAAGISHDFNNILSIIMLQVELGLRSLHQPEKLQKQLETIAQHSKRAAQMVQQILDFSRNTVLKPRSMDLVLLLRELVELLQLTLLKNVKVQLTYGSEVCIINGDPARIQQIFTNLAVNARDAMYGAGEVGINVERLWLESKDVAPIPGMELGEWVRVSVSDTGTGIAPMVMPHLFEPFFTTKEPGQGTGLGLAQVYGLVRQHRGHIDVRTQEGEGTTFVIYLPALNM